MNLTARDLNIFFYHKLNIPIQRTSVQCMMMNMGMIMTRRLPEFNVQILWIN